MNEELKVIITAEIAKLKTGIANAQKQVSTFKSNVAKYSKNIDGDFKKIGESISKGLKVAGTAMLGTGAALLALGGSTAEYRNQQAKLTTAFETAGSNANTAKQTYNDLYRVLGESDTAVEAAGHLAKLTTEEEALSQWTNICQGVYATFGDSLPIEGLTEAANETAKTGTVTGTLADALNWAGVSEDAFNEKLAACNTEAERETLIRETLNGLYDDAAKTYEKNAAATLAQNEAQAKLSENMATLGGAIQPVITALTSMAADCLAVITPYIQAFIDKYLPSIIEILAGVAGALETALSWISQHKEILAVMAGIIAGVVVAIGLYNAVAAVKAAMDAAQVTTLGGLIAAQLAHAAAALAAIAPYLLIVAAIAAVIAIIVLCVKHWDTIKAKVIEVATAIKEKVLEMVEKVKEWFSNMKDKISEAIENAKTAVTEKFESIKTAITEKVTAAKEAAVAKFEEIKTQISNKILYIKTQVSTKFAQIKQAISDKVSEAKQAVIDRFTEIKDGISEKITAAKDKVSTIFESIRSIVSSKVTQVKAKVSGVFESIKTSITDKIDAAKDGVSSAIDKIKGFFTGWSWSLPKIKLPHFSITGSFSLAPPSIPKFSVSWYAKGGVFDKPTLFPYGNGSIGGLGEAGAEAVVPLENNTKWLDKIAEKLSAKQGNKPIVLEVDGKVFAQTSIDSINQLTRQSGKLGLNLI